MKNKLLVNFKAFIISFVFLIIISHLSSLISHLSKAEASALSLSIDPPIIEIQALPPTNLTSNLTIQNKSDDEINLKIELRQFKAKEEKGELEYTASENTLILKNVQILDNSIPVTNINLTPNQQKNLALSINISKNTNISDYYFSIVFISDNTSSPTTSASLNQLGIASNVLLSVGPKETPNIFLEEFSSPLFLEKGPVPFTVRLNNKDTHFAKPKGEILIKNMFGQTIGKLDLQAINILSDSIRAMQDALWKEDFLLGLYTATLSISTADSSTIFTKSISFFAFPFQGLIVIVVIAIIVVIINSKLKKIRTGR
ncbi:MAG: hypothetical protein Q7R51_01280 [bacterium]|nr:hypothetical protein [bacterium]